MRKSSLSGISKPRQKDPKYSEAGLPHENVYARLRPSKIHGVGVFAIRNIKRRTNLFPQSEQEKIVWIDRKIVWRLRGEARDLYSYYGIHMGTKIGVPINFSQANIFWYLNHSCRPNAYIDQDYRVMAARNINKGEEITFDYRTIMDIDIPKNWKK